MPPVRGAKGRLHRKPEKVYADKGYDYPSAGRSYGSGASSRELSGAASIPARGWVATGGWWKGHWPVFPATVHLPYATSGAPMITRVACCLRPRLPSTPARPLCQERGLAVARRGAD